MNMHTCITHTRAKKNPEKIRWSWKNGSACKMIPTQAGGAEFDPQNPRKEAESGGVCL